MRKSYIYNETRNINFIGTEEKSPSWAQGTLYFVQRYVKQYSCLSGLVNSLKERLDSWKETPINVGVTGRSGSGKSSFINAIRDLRASDKGAAKVGVNETTIEPQSYPHPLNKNLLFWDLPGVGTPKFPRDKYLDAIEFEKFDFYIIVSCDRFTDDDLWLAQEIQRAKKHFYFLRTKIDHTVSDAKQDQADPLDEHEVLQSIRDSIATELGKAEIENPDVYLTSNHKKGLWDFERAKAKLMEDFPKLKRDAIVLSMVGHAKTTLSQKKEVLKDRIIPVAIYSTAANLVPIPGFSYNVDICMIKDELEFYEKQLGLDETSLKNLARDTNVDIEELQIITEKVLYREDDIGGALSKRKGTVRTLLSFVPLIGSVVNVDAGEVIADTLNDILEEYLKCSENVFDYCTGKIHMQKSKVTFQI